jgi:hypothetical protein
MMRKNVYLYCILDNIATEEWFQRLRSYIGEICKETESGSSRQVLQIVRNKAIVNCLFLPIYPSIIIILTHSLSS